LNLNRPEFTCYPEEKEILLQAGLIAKVISITYEPIGADKIAVFELNITEGRQRINKLRDILLFVVPISLFFIGVYAEDIYRSKYFEEKPYGPKWCNQFYAF
jgi:hypothetical protein